MSPKRDPKSALSEKSPYRIKFDCSRPFDAGNYMVSAAGICYGASTMARDLSLSGGDIAVIKCFPAGGTPIKGKDLFKAANMMEAEFVDTLLGLIILDIVKTTKTQFKSAEEIEGVTFSLNSGLMKDVRSAMRPQAKKPSGRR